MAIAPRNRKSKIAALFKRPAFPAAELDFALLLAASPLKP
jgi:hypothetical protein